MFVGTDVKLVEERLVVQDVRLVPMEEERRLVGGAVSLVLLDGHRSGYPVGVPLGALLSGNTSNSVDVGVPAVDGNRLIQVVDVGLSGEDWLNYRSVKKLVLAIMKYKVSYL